MLIWKRLEGAKFKWPAISDGVMRLSAAQLAALFEGLDWKRVYAPRIRRPQVAGNTGCVTLTHLVEDRAAPAT